MLSPLALVGLALTILSTSFLSGIFGMAGGMILLGVCVALMDVAPAMVLHGVTQLSANGWRAVLWRAEIKWWIVWRYGLAMVATYIALRSVALIPNKAVVYLGLGLTPFVSKLLPASLKLDITRPLGPYLGGTIIGMVQILAGAGGSVLDLFFQNSKLGRKEIVATKAATQVVGHLSRILYFGSFAEAFTVALPVWQYAAAIAIAMIGTTLAGPALARMTDNQFRRWSGWIINSVAYVFLARGLWLLVGA